MARGNTHATRMKRAAAALVCVLLAGCVNMEESYRPPIRRQPMAGLIGEPELSAVRMNDPQAAAYFVRDIDTQLIGGLWRWTAQHPQLRLRAPAKPPLKLKVEYSVAEVLFKETGPVTVSFVVGGKKLGEARCDAPGLRKFEKEIPPDLLSPGEPVEVVMDVDKVFRTPDTGRLYGIQLIRVALEP